MVLDPLGHFDGAARFDLADNLKKARRLNQINIVLSEMRKNVGFETSKDQFCVARGPGRFGGGMSVPTDGLESVQDDRRLRELRGTRINPLNELLPCGVSPVPSLS
jgi:hypothetical protein